MDSTAADPATPCCVYDRPPPPAPGNRKAGLKDLLPVLIALPTGALLAYYFGPLLPGLLMPHHGARLVKGLVLLGLPLLWMLAVVLHEFGHLVGGWLVGGRFILFCAGPFLWQRSPEGIRFRLNRSLNLFGGLAACIPRDPALITPRRFSVMILGGPAASLLQTLLFVSLAWGMKSSVFFAQGDWPLIQHLLCFGALFSAMIFLLTIMPATVQGMKSDGLRALGLLRKGPKTDQETAMLALNALSLSGTRSAELPADLIRRSLALNDRSLFDLYGHFTAYYHKADLGHWSEAQAHLDHVLSNEAAMAPHMRTALRCEYAWLLATQGPFAASARAWLDSAGEFKLDPATRLRAEAAVLLAEGRLDEASLRVAEARAALLSKSMGEKPSEFSLDALARIQSQITARRP